MRWFVINKYDNKNTIKTAKLFETTWLTRYTFPMRITSNQGSELVGHGFRKPLTGEQYRILSNTSTLGNLTYNYILEWSHTVIGNLLWAYKIKYTYIYEDEPWLGILMAADFTIFSTTNMLKGYSICQWVLGHYIILPIKHKMYWELIHKKSGANQ